MRPQVGTGWLSALNRKVFTARRDSDAGLGMTINVIKQRKKTRHKQKQASAYGKGVGNLRRATGGKCLKLVSAALEGGRPCAGGLEISKVRDARMGQIT